MLSRVLQFTWTLNTHRSLEHTSFVVFPIESIVFLIFASTELRIWLFTAENPKLKIDCVNGQELKRTSRIYLNKKPEW